MPRGLGICGGVVGGRSFGNGVVGGGEGGYNMVWSWYRGVVVVLVWFKRCLWAIESIFISFKTDFLKF